jgi:thiamine kinase-like enzyme
VLEDLSESHTEPTAWPLPPTMAQCETILRTLARFNAEWWDDPRLGVSVGTWLDPDTQRQNLKGLCEHFAAFTGRVGDRLSAERRDLYRRLIDAVPRLTARYHSHRDVTLIHGDAHVWNVLMPKDEHSADVRIFDWDTWRIGLPTTDLAYMMAMHWYPDLRRQRERPLLDCYHAALLASGVGGYDRRALDDDYRLSVLLQTLTPVLQEAYGIPPWVWWNNLERIMLAVDDLGCRALLG